jgi:hypothetical protein
MVNRQHSASEPSEEIAVRPSRAGRNPGRLLVAAVAAGSLALSAAGCTRARAETVPDGPPLATPAPPPRVLAPVEEVLAEAPPEREIPEAPPPAPPAAQPPAPRRPPVADTQKPAEPEPEPPPPAVAEAPARQPAANPAEEKKIFEVLQRFNRDIGRVNYQNLKGDGKAQYDLGKRFAQLAEQEIKNRNYPLAATHADKAATIAAELLGQ